MLPRDGARTSQVSPSNSNVSDPDGVYKTAVTKLRALLSATHAASFHQDDMTTNDEEEEDDFIPHPNGNIPYAGSVERLEGWTDPPKPRKRLYAKNVSSGVRRALFNGKTIESERERHSSWHHLEHLDQPREKRKNYSCLHHYHHHLIKICSLD